ncbi:hypothetical protein HDU98_004326 [Podochytrium sp. JEL0797]|nr:hypothetical protein HDU98_004326 [Podochytrium sp. JEL0797]
MRRVVADNEHQDALKDIDAQHWLDHMSALFRHFNGSKTCFEGSDLEYTLWLDHMSALLGLRFNGSKPCFGKRFGVHTHGPKMDLTIPRELMDLEELRSINVAENNLDDDDAEDFLHRREKTTDIFE